MAKTTTSKLTLDELAAQYGYAAAFFFSTPELKALITQAVKEQWSVDKFRAKFLATKWYRAHSASTRTWVELAFRDPAEARKRIEDQRLAIQQMANEMGITIAPDRLAKLANDSLMFGWSDELLRQSIAAEFRYQGSGGTQGRAASLEDLVRGMANDFGVKVSDEQVAQWIGGALSGKYTEDHLRDFLKDMARSRYPGMASYLDQGLTVRDIANNYIQSYADILEQPTDAIQLTDPLIQNALQGAPAPGDKVGAPQMMSLYAFESQLRKDPRWLKTKNARDQMTSAALGILQDWGLYG